MIKKIYKVSFKFILASFFILSEILFPEIENFLSEKLGLFSFMLPLYFILSAIVDMLRDKKIRILYKTRLNFLYLLVFLGANLIVIFIQNGVEQDEFIYIASNKNNYGDYLTAIFYYMNFVLGNSVTFAFSGIVIFLSLFVFFGKAMSSFIRQTKHYFSKAGAEERRHKNLKKRKVKMAKKALKQKQKEIRETNKLKKKKRTQIIKEEKVFQQEEGMDLEQPSETVVETHKTEESKEVEIEEQGIGSTENELISANQVESVVLPQEEPVILETELIDTEKEETETAYDNDLESIMDEIDGLGTQEESEEEESHLPEFLYGKEEFYVKAYNIILEDRDISVVKLQSRLEIGYKKAKEIYLEISEELE